MQTIKLRIAEKIASAVLAINAEAQLNAQDVAAMLEYPPDSNMGDLAFPCFNLSRVLRRSPVQIAATLCEALATDEVIGQVGNCGKLTAKEVILSAMGTSGLRVFVHLSKGAIHTHAFERKERAPFCFGHRHGSLGLFGELGGGGGLSAAGEQAEACGQCKQ
jgi:hypothetical protein